MAKQLKDKKAIYDEQAKKLTNKYLKKSNFKLVFVESTTEDGQPCMIAQLVNKSADEAWDALTEQAIEDSDKIPVIIRRINDDNTITTEVYGNIDANKVLENESK